MLKAPKFWYQSNFSILAILLLPLSLIWITGTYLKKKFAKPIRSKIPVIAIGSAIIGGKAGRFWGYGMRRGTIVFAKDQEIPVQVFKETNYDFTSYWGLMRPTIESFNGPMQSFLDKTPRRFVGDLAFGGKGECLLPPKTI